MTLVEELRKCSGLQWRTGRALMLQAAAEIERLQMPSERWPVVREQDGYKIGACPLCGAEHVIGETE